MRVFTRRELIIDWWKTLYTYPRDHGVRDMIRHLDYWTPGVVGRLLCRIGRHNITCRGRRDHIGR